MANVIESVHLSPLASRALEAGFSSENLLEIPDPAPVLSAYGFAPGRDLYDSLPAVMRGGVQTAPHGVIQDPAGSAVGRDLAGAGASGAIYAFFDALPDSSDRLCDIPDIPAGAAIFNASQGAGRRVLHTHSPSLQRLNLQPASDLDRGRALAEIGNAYYNAIAAFNARSADLGDDGRLLNLVPVSAGIYGGAFANNRSEWDRATRHLDPTYTLTAVALALAQWRAQYGAVPSMNIYYFGADVYKTAVAEVARLQGA